MSFSLPVKVDADEMGSVHKFHLVPEETQLAVNNTPEQQGNNSLELLAQVSTEQRKSPQGIKAEQQQQPNNNANFEAAAFDEVRSRSSGPLVVAEDEGDVEAQGMLFFPLFSK